MKLDERVPEPELMEEPGQAEAYDAAEFSVAHDAIVTDLLRRHPDLISVQALHVVDLGCGPADVTVRMARALPLADLVGVDAGPRMLGRGRERVAREGLGSRLRLVEARVDGELSRLDRAFDLVASNSLLHHLSDPVDLWRAVRAIGVPGAAVHVADLRRPRDTDQVDALVEREASGAPRLLRADFRRSLMAAYRPAEVEEQLFAVGLGAALRVEVISDRHLVVWGHLPR